MTLTMKKRKAPDGTPEPSGVGDGDRLSGLPDELIGRILSFLPTPQVALTAQLSRRWRRAWAHVVALNLSVRDCVRRGEGPRFCALATAALARFPTPGIPAISVEVDHHIYLVDEWYDRAMARAVGSVRVASLQGLSFLRFPPCTRAEALDVTAPRTTLALPDPEADLAFGRLAELSLAQLQLGGARPLDEFLASCCPRLRTLRLRRVRGHPVRRLALRTAALEVLDLDTVDDLATLDVVAANLRCLSVSSCFRLRLPRGGGGGGGEVTVSAPRIEAVCWYRSYPEQLTFRDGLAHVRRLAGPLKLPTLGRLDQFDAPYTTQLLRSCALAVDRLDMELVVPDEMALLNWLGAPPAPDQARATCEDLIRHVPALPCVRALSLKIRWGCGGDGVAPRLASFLSRTPSLTRLRIDASPYCLAVYEGEDEEAAPPRRGKQQQWKRSDVGADEQSRVRLDGLREMSVDGLKGTDSEENKLVQLLLASAPPSLERMSLTFRDAAPSIVDEIAAEILVHFPMATGRWDRCTTSVLTWTRLLGRGVDDLQKYTVVEPCHPAGSSIMDI